MNKLISTILLLTVSLGLSGQLILPDEYWGGDPTHSNYNQDVIQGPNTDIFEIDGYRFETAGDSLTIEIHGNYFKAILDNDPDLLNTFMGDLFISTNGLSWTEGGASTLNDYFGSGNETSWDYAVSINPRDNSGGGLTGLSENNPQSADIYAITGDGTIELSQDHTSASYIFRKHQEVNYVPGSNQSPENTTASWFISDDLLSITLDDAAGLFGNSDNIGFHWTMSCGNDVIEFDYTTITPVPEPSQIGALGIVGMGAFMVLRRRLRRRSAARAS